MSEQETISTDTILALVSCLPSARNNRTAAIAKCNHAEGGQGERERACFGDRDGKSE